MKLNVITKPKFRVALKKGQVIRLRDSLDSHNGIYEVRNMDEQCLILRNVKSNKELVIASSDDVSRYDYEVGSMQFVAAGNTKQAAPDKKEYQTKEAYIGSIEDLLKRRFGNGADIKIMGI